MVEYLPPPATRDLYRELASLNQVVRLGDVAEVGIGYVTGNNDFFHLTAADVEKWHASAVERVRCGTGARVGVVAYGVEL